MAAMNMNQEQFKQLDPGGKACFGGFLGALVQLLPEDRPCV